MNTAKYFILLLAFVVLAASQLPQVPDGYADIYIIDNFEVPTPVLVIVTSSTNIPSSLTGFTQDSSIMGGERDLILSVTAGATNLVLSAGVANGLYSVAAPNGASGKSTLVYDGIDGSSGILVNGLDDFDFTQQGAANSLRTVANADLPTIINFIVYENYGGNQCELTLNIPAGDNPISYEIPFSSFTGYCNFTAVGAFAVNVPINDNTDVELRLLSLFGPVPSGSATPSRYSTPTPTPTRTPSRYSTASPTGTPSRYSTLTSTPTRTSSRYTTATPTRTRAPFSASPTGTPSKYSTQTRTPTPQQQGNDFVCCLYYSSAQKFESAFCQETGFWCPQVYGFYGVGNSTVSSCQDCFYED